MSEKLSKYLIEAFDPRYWLYDLTDGGENVHQFTWPEGRWEKNECSDTIYVNGTETPYHEHTKGVECFLISRGHVTAIIRNKRTTVDKGDMILIPPYVGHGFIHYDDGEGMVWRECFQEIDMSGGIERKCRIKDNYGDELYYNPEFRKRYLASHNDISREAPEPVDVEKKDIYEIRPYDFGFSTYSFGKLTLKQKVGRWETHGVKEVWQIHADSGVSLNWDDPYGSSEIFLVVKGKTHWKVLDEEFDAGDDCYIKVPAYAKHSVQVLEDDTEIIDLGCSCYLNDMLEEYTALRKRNPERMADKEEVKKLMRKFNCFLTDCVLE